MKAATIKDIAHELDIHHSTVSRALKDHPDVAPKTQKLVIETAKKLNYTPNAAASALRSGKPTGTLISLPEEATLVIPEILETLHAELRRNSLKDVAIVTGDNSFPGMFANRLLVSMDDADDTDALLAATVGNERTAVVHCSLREQMRSSMDALLTDNKRQLALLTTPVLGDQHERLFNQLSLDRFLPVRSRHVIRATHAEGLAGNMVEQLFGHVDSPNGIIVSSAWTAIELADYLGMNDHQVSIVCLDANPVGKRLWPTIRWFGFDIGAIVQDAVEWLSDIGDAEPAKWFEAKMA